MQDSDENDVRVCCVSVVRHPEFHVLDKVIFVCIAAEYKQTDNVYNPDLRLFVLVVVVWRSRVENGNNTVFRD